MDYGLKNEQIHTYHENGFITIKNLFSNQECKDLLGIMYQYADKDFSAILNLDRRVTEIRKIMKDPRIVSILSAIQQAEVVGLQTQIIFKEPQSPYALHAWNPHQDNAYFQSPDGATLNCHIALANHDIENGCLYGYSGSHKDGVFTFTPKISHKASPNSNPGNKVSEDVLERFKNNKRDFILKKGDTLFMDGNTIHGSYPNVSGSRPRPILTMCFITKGKPFVPGKNAKRMEIPLQDDVS